ncbi:MAG: SufS family cysteine desulfurase [Proteobacteria bacterium]|nr:SufS family cysteine desulfurase [Pseudomonadota bacterium]
MNTADFPILKQTISGKPLIYLDTAATSQKPQMVLDALQKYYQHDHANVHRGVHTLSARATAAYEAARKKLQKFINAEHSHEIIFTRGATESINLVANCFGRLCLKPGDEIILSSMEHHANIVPWQVICEQTGAQIKVIPLQNDGSLDLLTFKQLINPKTKLVALTHISHVLGTLNPVKSIIAMAHQQNVPVLIDGAQAVAHIPIDVKELDCDFYVFSGHKMYGPTGIGVVYAKSSWLEKMPPYQTGGGMIRRVSFQKTEYGDLPDKFEAGTPNIGGAVGLGAAVDFLSQYDYSQIMAHEVEMMSFALDMLHQCPEIHVLPAPGQQVGVISFTMKQAHPHDIGTILNQDGIAVRAGHHCAMPLMETLKVPATVRISFGIYNDVHDLENFAISLKKVIKVLGI